MIEVYIIQFTMMKTEFSVMILKYNILFDIIQCKLFCSIFSLYQPIYHFDSPSLSISLILSLAYIIPLLLSPFFSRCLNLSISSTLSIILNLTDISLLSLYLSLSLPLYLSLSFLL